jgi:hypothetical protein
LRLFIDIIFKLNYITITFLYGDKMKSIRQIFQDLKSSLAGRELAYPLYQGLKWFSLEASPSYPQYCGGIPSHSLPYGETTRAFTARSDAQDFTAFLDVRYKDYPGGADWPHYDFYISISSRMSTKAGTLLGGYHFLFHQTRDESWAKNYIRQWNTEPGFAEVELAKNLPQETVLRKLTWTAETPASAQAPAVPQNTLG